MSVSILICCHNAAQRLPATLEHLRAQRECSGIDWEIVLVDNGSSDGSSEVAAKLLAAAPAPFTILHEPRPGKTNAFLTGLARCRHEFISIVDDDNWVSQTWVRDVDVFLTAHPEVGIVGSLNEPVFETPAPEWFWKVPGHYACGHHSVGAGDVTDSIGFVFGAGATFRMAAWKQLCAAGFSFYTTTIRGKGGCAGEDLELCAAIRANGWRIYFEPGLTLRHFMPATRITWEQARLHARGLGTSALVIDPYCISAGPGRKEARLGRWRQTWQWQAIAKLRALCRRGFFPLKLWRAREGDVTVLALEMLLGALGRILNERHRYTRHLRNIAGAAWRTTG